MKVLVVYCFISNLKDLFIKCLCISVGTKHSDTSTTNNIRNKDTTLSFKTDSKLGIIYEDIEYNNLRDF